MRKSAGFLFVVICFLMFACAARELEHEEVDTDMALDIYEEDISEEDLREYTRITEKAQNVAADIQNTMISEIENAGLEVERFHEIDRAQLQALDIEVSEEEMQRYSQASEKVEELREKNKRKQEEVIEDSGMTLERYEEISASLQYDEELYQKYMSIRDEGK